MGTAGTEDSTFKQLREENQRLNRAVEELSILNDLAREIGSSLDSQEIMRKIVSRSLRGVSAEQGVITLVSQEAEDLTKTLVRCTVSSAEHRAFHLNDSLLGWMYLNKVGAPSRPRIMICRWLGGLYRT